MRKLQGHEMIAKINFETTKHHRQSFREQIKP